MTAALSNRPVPRPGILDIEAYVGGKSTAHGVSKVYKLSSNESPLGANPKAIEAYRSVADTLELYPDGSSTALREAIGKAYGLAPDRLVCGCGSDEILHLLAQAYLGPGDEGLYPQYGFLVYPIAIKSFGATPVTAPETDHTVNVDAMLAAVTDKTRVVFLANPSNPTGTYIPFDEVKRLHKGLPSNVLLVLDAAYAEYVRANDYEAGLELVASSENVVMTRTFSKIHGLASLRIGWAYGPDHVIDVLNRIRGPFNLSAAAIAAGTASISDRAFIEKAIDFNTEWLAKVAEDVRALGLGVTPSVTNFLLVHFPTTPGQTAAEADAFLQSKGVIVRRLNAYGLPDALRVTIGTPEANAVFVAALKEFVK